LQLKIIKIELKTVLGRKMREVISIHIGQAGVQMGNACWELYWSVFPTDFIFCLWLLNFVPGPLTSHHFTLSNQAGCYKPTIPSPPSHFFCLNKFLVQLIYDFEGF
jgi:hypothetical protein